MFSMVCLTSKLPATRSLFCLALCFLSLTAACKKPSTIEAAAATPNQPTAAQTAPTAQAATSPTGNAPANVAPGSSQVSVGIAPDYKPAGASPAAAAIPNVSVSPGASPTIRHIENGKMIIVQGKNGIPGMEGPPATPTPTPAPTPAVEVVNGKIKQEWQAPAEFVSMKSPLKVTPDIVKKGQGLYKNRCEICHGAEGKGNGAYNDPKWKQATNLASKAVQANTDGELFYKISTSRDRHPASKVLYTEEERWMVVAFLRSLK